MVAEPSTNVIVGIYRPPTLADNPDEPEVLFIKYRVLKERPKVMRKKVPGGGARRGETVREAGVREVHDETGLRPLDNAPTSEIFLGEVNRRNRIERKYGLMVALKDCDGHQHEEPVVENKTIINGTEWMPISKAIKLMEPKYKIADTSHHNFLIKMRDILVQRGECPAPKGPNITL